MSLLYVFLLISINGRLQQVAASGADSMQMRMIHRHSPEIADRLGHKQPKTRMEQTRELVNVDREHNKVISRVLSQRRMAREVSIHHHHRHRHRHRHHHHHHHYSKVHDLEENENDEEIDFSSSSIETEIFSGSYIKVGSYFIPLKMGTPSQRLLLVANTADDLTWVKCLRPCPDCEGYDDDHNNKVFRPNESSTFSPIPCSSSLCSIDLSPFYSLDICPIPEAPCQYNYSYYDGKMAEGFFANETVTVYLSTGKKIRLSEFLVGCTLATPGRNFTDGIHGMLALGASPYSFAGQAVEIFGGKFSYCLVDILSPKNVSNYIVFGHNVHPPNMQFTSLIVNKIAPFYAVRVIGISVGGELLGIPLSVWNEDREGGTIIDSGTSLMQLAEPAYRPIMDAFISSPGLKDYTRVDDEDFEFCISVKPGELDEERVPKLIIYFADGARLVPPVRNYLHEAAPELMCLAFQPVPFPGVSVIGNLIQQHYFWEFDFMKRRLGFAPSSCTQHGH